MDVAEHLSDPDAWSHVEPERCHIAAPGDRLAGSGARQRRDDLARIVPAVLDRGVDADLIAGIDQRIGDVGGDAQRLATADAGAGDAVDARRLGGVAARPVAQVGVVFGLAARDVQRGLEPPVPLWCWRYPATI
jgi:hypothetical protein